MKSALLTLALICLAVPAFAQSTPGAGTFGIGTQISGNASVAAPGIMTMSNGLNGIYCVTSNITLLGGFGLSTTSDVGTVFNLNVGGYYRFNRNQLTPIIGGLIFINVISPSGAGVPSTTQFGFVLGGGAEYYFSKNFSTNLVEGLQFNTEPSTFAFVSKLGLNWYF